MPRNVMHVDQDHRRGPTNRVVRVPKRSNFKIHHLVALVWPVPITEKEINELLWGATCYPVGGISNWLPQVIEAGEKYKGSVGAAIVAADAEMTHAMDEYHQIEERMNRDAMQPDSPGTF